jgi:spore germination protein KC
MIFSCMPLYGCWDYVGLNEIGIAIGLAIDKDTSTNMYKLTYEIIDLQKSSKDQGTQTTLVESEGKTLFEAVRNAKSKSATKMFFGSMEVLIISEQIAKEESIKKCIDLFLRDAEPRETINVVISQEPTAKALLKVKGITNSITSTEIKTIIKKDHKITSKTGDIEMFEVYELLNDSGRQLTLPAFHVTMNNDKQTVESNGIALFNSDKLIGYLSPEETFYFLFITNEVMGGVFVLEDGDHSMVSLEINKNKTKSSYQYDEKKDNFTVTIEIQMEVFLGEYNICSDELDNYTIEKIQKKADKELSKQIKNIIQKVQMEYISDIFGFGNLVYRKDPKLWAEVSKNWNKYFTEIEIEVKSQIHITNTGFMKN